MTQTRNNTIVIASAGTGKTYRLVSEFVEAVTGGAGFEPIPPRRILALTFTEKAAAEMKVRISDRLAHARIRDLDQSPITTYHAFCARILRDFGDAVGVDSRFILLDEFEEHELATKVSRRITLAAIETGDQALLALIARLGLHGVAGHLTRIRDQIIESGLEPRLVPPLVIAPMEKAIADCESAFSAYDDIWESLNPAAQERVKRAREAWTAFCTVATLATSDATEVALSSLFSTLRECVAGRFGPDAPRRALIEAISSVGEITCRRFLETETKAFSELLLSYWDELEKVKKSTMQLAFGDLLVLTRKLLRENKAVRTELKARYDRVLVDEYQDTSPIQEDIVALLCERNADHAVVELGQTAIEKINLEPGKLFVVGDPKQSIYGFRGSDARLFYRMVDQITAQGGTQESLTLSRRSSAAVVQLVNRAVTCDEREKLVAMREDGSVEGALLRDQDEPRIIASQVAALIADEGVEPKDIVVLVRRIKKATPILRALIRSNVPARIWGGEGFFERQEVVELAAALQLVIEPENALALLTVLRSPLIAFDDTFLPELFQATHATGFGLSSLQTAVCTGAFDVRTQEKLHAFFAFLNSVKSQKHLISLGEAFDKLLRINEYESQLDAQTEANVQKLRTMLLEIEGDFESQITQLVRRVRHAPKEAQGEEQVEPNAVRIMTIHQSKGLEFGVVIVADTSAIIPSDGADVGFDAEEGLAISHRGRPIAVCAPEGGPIGAVRARQRAKNEAELMRLLYVALTRARDRIYVVDNRGFDADGKARNRGVTLLNLFLQSADGALEVRTIPVTASASEAVQAPAHIEASLHGPANNPMLLVPGSRRYALAMTAPLRALVFASDLSSVATTPALRAERLVYQPPAYLSDDQSKAERGHVAHELLRSATQLLALPDFEDRSAIEKVLGASLRMMGLEQNAELIDACVTTLESAIWPLLKAEFEIRFEVPMRYENSHVVIKGFADAIATRGDIQCVIDFKSSLFAAQSERTNLQLLAYCASLQSESTRLFYATCVIGDEANLEFIPFEDAELRKLENHLSEVLRS